MSAPLQTVHSVGAVAEIRYCDDIDCSNPVLPGETTCASCRAVYAGWAQERGQREAIRERELRLHFEHPLIGTCLRVSPIRTIKATDITGWRLEQGPSDIRLVIERGSGKPDYRVEMEPYYSDLCAEFGISDELAQARTLPEWVFEDGEVSRG